MPQQLKQISKMGSMTGLLGMLPGVGKIKQQIEPMRIWITPCSSGMSAIIGSMTAK